MTHRTMYFILTLILFLLVISACTPAKESNTTSTFTPAFCTPQSLTATSSPSAISSATNTPLPAQVQHFTDRLLVCQPPQNGGELSFQFYWLDLSCLNREDACQQILEPYFDLPMEYEGEKSRLDFSTDGQSLLYLENRNLYDQTMDLYVRDLRVGTTSLISFNTDIVYVQYAADARQILYITKNAGLYLTDASGSGWQIVPDYYVSLNAAFAPDGKKIAFAGEPRKLPDGCADNKEVATDLFIYLVNLENGSNSVTQLSPLRVEQGRCGQLFYAHPLAWSADSTRLVYTRELEPQREIVCMMDLFSQVERCYPDAEFADIGAYELSVEDQLVLSAARCPDEPQHDIYLLDMVSGKLSVICEDEADESNPIWVENDQMIAYEAAQGDFWQVYLTDTLGDFHQQLTTANTSSYLNGNCRSH
jgi:Tol biopolymer transport system component